MSDLNTKIIPFEFTAQQASHAFARYVSRNKLNPTEVFEAARQGRVKPVYFPAFVFDCEMTTVLKSECTKREAEEISTVLAQRELKSEFADLLALSGDKVDETLLSLLEPYDLQELQDYDSALTVRAEVQKAVLSAEEVFEKIRPEVEQSSVNEIKKTLRDFTSEKTQELSHSFNSVNAKNILLPMWVLDCEYKGQPCRLFMNGQTGKIAGVPPRSTNRTLALLGAGAAIGAVIGQLIWMAVKTIW
ncbi:MAG: hypothetical protein IKK09_10065 [Clostridia bacterium]|nr:hypothetical protein [Clostridia bacterium]